MKIHKIIGSLLMGAAMVLAGCDNIGEDERYIELGNDTPRRAVLLEEFTGQMCTNCPEGHEIVHKLKEQYGDYFIPVSIHASVQSLSEADGGLGIPAGTEIFNASGCKAIPAGIVDGTTGVVNRDQWAAAVRADIYKVPKAEIEVEAMVLAGTITIRVTVDPKADIKGNLSVWVLENDITGFQLDGADYKMDYVHNHVLRRCVNGTWGTELPLVAGQQSVTDLTTEKADGWVSENLNVIAFVTDGKGVSAPVVNAAICNVKAPIR